MSSPMWFVLDDESALMTTRGHSWKVRRIRNNPRVRITWSNSSGQMHGEPHEGVAELVEGATERGRAIAALNKKYGLKKKLIDFGLKFAKDKTEAILKVTLTES